MRILLSAQYGAILATPPPPRRVSAGKIVLLLTAYFTQSKWLLGVKDYPKYAAKTPVLPQPFMPEHFPDFSIPFTASVIVSNPIFM